MPTSTAAADAELVARAARGEQAAFTALFERYADRVHDHVARWSRDATLAADATRAAFVALLGDLDAPREADVGVLPWLLRTARSRAVDRLRGTERADQDTGGRVATAVLAATPTDHDTPAEVAATTHGAAELVWEVAASLDDRAFSVLDLHVRQELTNAEVATVLDVPRDDADVLVRRMRDRVQTLFGAVALLARPTRDCTGLESLRGAAAAPMDLATARRIRDHAQECVTCGPRRATAAAPLRVYAALAGVRAPLAVRTGVLAAAAEHFGTAPSTSAAVRRALPVGLTLVLLLAVVGGIASALRSATPEPTDGPPTAAGEPVIEPSATPSPTPSPTPTLQALPSASPVPVPSPEPTVDPEPSPSPEPTPSPTPSPEPSPTVQQLAVSIDAPSAGEVVPATTQDDQGRQAGQVAVAASVSGGGTDVSIVWTSDRAPDDVLLATAQGQLLLWLSEACTDTPHVLTVTATDEVTGEVVSEAVQVQVTETCVDRLTVSITEPRSGTTVRRNPGSTTVTFSVAADVSDDDVSWAWTTSLAPGSPILTSQSGEVEVQVDDCEGSTSFTLFVDVDRTSDGSTAQHDVPVNVECPA